MKTKHTPGPWRTSRHDTLKTVRHIDAGPAGYERTTVAIIDGRESEANARLIAAAPALLAALEECRKAMLKVRNDPYTTCCCAEQLALADREAKAAIAAATGEDVC